MKLKIFINLGIVGVLTTACFNSEKRYVVNNNVPEKLQVQDEVFKNKDSVGTFVIDAQWPKDTTLLVSNMIGEYYSELMGGTYHGSYCEFDKMMNHYLDEITQQYHRDAVFFEDRHELNLLDSLKFKVYSENDRYVTITCDRSSYAGGAHGSFTVSGATFRKQDGRKMGWDIFKNIYDHDFQELIREGLEGYWNIESDGELKSYLLDDNVYSIPLPETNPLFTEKGVEFVYNQYEISPYAAGTPTFVVPYSELSPFMTLTAKRLFE